MPTKRASVFAFLAVLVSPGLSRADVTSWMMLGGGAGSLEQTGLDRIQRGILQTELGIGSPPAGAVIIGGVFKTTTFLSNGTDLMLQLRGASGGFVRGGWGFALDAGGYQRWWGDSSTGFVGGLVLGAPFGLQASLQFERGTDDVRTYAAVLGVDLLRLTVYRTHDQQYWPNPFPAERNTAGLSF